MRLKFLEKSESKYILLAGIFSFVYFFLIIPVSNNFFDSRSPYTQFLLFNLGLFFMIQIFFKSLATNSRPKFINVIGMMVLIVAISVWSPPYSVLTNGTIATNVNSGPFMVLAGSDTIVGITLTNLGVHGGFIMPSFIPLVGGNQIGWVFILTYTLVPIILLFISGKLMKDFVKNI